MRFFVTGRERRDVYLKYLLEQKGHAVSSVPPWDGVILSLPRSSVSDEWIPHLPAGQKILCGITGPDLDALSKQKGWQMHRILQDARFTEENACLTAEGALFYAAYQSDSSLRGAKCLVIGYGRIGKELTRLLRSMGASVTVAARREESRMEAGEGSVDISQIENVLPSVDLAFNTVPHPVIGKHELEKAKRSALLMDLASAPYGIDLEAARSMGLNVSLESGVPGRYCPRTAARLILDYMEREGFFYAP